MNKSSESYKAYDQVAAPNAGARLGKGKDPLNCDDSLGKTESGVKIVKQVVQSEFVAKEDSGAARRAVNKQIGDTAIPAKKSAHQQV